MALEIRVPRLGWNMETGTFTGWLKKDGEAVQEGAPLFAVEGDKALQEVEAVGSGILRISADAPQPGATVAVGALLGHLVEAGESPPAEAPRAASPGPAESPTEAAPASAKTPALETPAAEAPVARIRAPETPAAAPRISPRARRIARELGVDWLTLRGSGRTGRIVERDVREAAESLAEPVAARVVPLSSLRRTIAERMQEGSNATAPVTLMTEADATELALLRDQLKEPAARFGEPAPTFTDLLVVLSARALTVHPILNARFEGDKILLEDTVHMALAVETPDGLLAPVIREAGRKRIGEIARETKGLIERARERKLSAEEMQGGTFTLSNIGMYGVDAFTPILNLPQCAILGVGRIVLKPAVHLGQVVPRQMVTLSLTFDHRVVDGAPAARFLSTVREYVEKPVLWLWR